MPRGQLLHATPRGDFVHQVAAKFIRTACTSEDTSYFAHVSFSCVCVRIHVYIYTFTYILTYVVEIK